MLGKSNNEFWKLHFANARKTSSIDSFDKIDRIVHREVEKAEHETVRFLFQLFLSDKNE